MFSSHAVFSFDKQLLLADLIGDLPWAFDLPSGILSFGDQFAWRAEVLGTESDEAKTWMWAWANHESNIPEQQQAAAALVRAGHGAP